MATPAGPVMGAQENLRKTLADVLAFREFASVADRDGALARIHHGALPPPQDPERGYTRVELQALRPCAILYTAERDGFTYEQVATSEGFDFGEQGNLVIELEREVPSEIALDLAEVDVDFLNQVGAVMRGLIDLFGRDTYLLGRSLSLAEGPYRSHPDDVPEVGDWQLAILNVTWES